MSFNHPRTVILEDPDLPPVATLLETPIPGPIEAAVAETSGRIESGDLIQVTWWPGRASRLGGMGYRLAVE